MYSPSGQTLDQINTCRSYDAAIAHRGHLDLVLLILQPNGALGLVGPGSSPTAGTRMVILPIETRLALVRAHHTSHGFKLRPRLNTFQHSTMSRLTRCPLV